MNEQHLHMDFMNGDTPPVPVPPVSQGWDAMRKLLDDYMPAPKPPRKWRPPSWTWAIITVVTVGGSVGIWRMRNHSTPGTTTTQSQSPAAGRTDDADMNTVIAVDSLHNTGNEQGETALPGVYTPSGQADRATGTGPVKTSGNEYTNTVKTDQTAAQGNTTSPNAVNEPASVHRPGPASGSQLPARQANAVQPGYTSTASDNAQRASVTTSQHEQNMGTVLPQRTTGMVQPGPGGSSQPSPASVANTLLHPLFTEDRMYHPVSLKGHNPLNGRGSITLPDPLPPRQEDAFTGWRIWLQWNPPLPLQGTETYFKGPGGGHQVWRPFVPGLRVTRTVGKGALALDMIPLTSQQANAVFSPDSLRRQDSVIYSRAVVKQFGSAAVLQYQYPLTDHWGISAGVSGSYWHKGLTRYRTALVQPGTVIDSLKTATAADLQHFSKVRIDGVAEVYYQAGHLQAGLRIGVPITRMGSDSARSYHNPVQAAIVVRWNLLSFRKRK